MGAMTRQNKQELGILIAKGHSRFGKVAPRKPYQDDEGGEGAPGLTVESHPLLAELPVGAASDLTAIAAANSEINEEALDRAEELTPALRNQPSMQAQLQQRYGQSYLPKLTPGG